MRVSTPQKRPWMCASIPQGRRRRSGTTTTPPPGRRRPRLVRAPTLQMADGNDVPRADWIVEQAGVPRY